MERLVTYLFLVIGLTMFIFAALLYSSRRRSSVTNWLGLYILGVGYVWFYYGMHRANGFDWAPWLLYSDILFELVAGPALFRYSRSLKGEAHPRDFRRFMPFAAAALYLAYLLIFRPSAGLAPQRLAGSNPSYFSNPAIDLVNTLADCFFFSYVSASTLTILGIYRSATPALREHFRGVVVYFILGFLTIVGFALGHVLRSDNLLGASVLVNGLNTTFLFFLSNRYPELTQRELKLPRPFAEVAPGPQPGAGGRGPDLLARLERLMVEQRAYRDSALSLQSLSTKLGVPNHQLSLLLNERLGLGFRGYVNRYRLEEARRLLVERPELPILDVAFAVGFNSKSAFNSAFARELGVSPTEFRKKGGLAT